jgi:AcrR family transcriptional regulator
MGGRARVTARKRLSASERREVIETAATEVFAEKGYGGASMDEIARRSGVSVPVLYDHFTSKLALHKRLLERHFAELRELWGEQLAGDESPEQRIPRAIDAWFAYAQTHPYAWRMLFRDTTGDPEVEAIHREVASASRAAALPLLAHAPGTERIAGTSEEQLEMAWEIVRAVMQTLAVWWYEHQHVPREQIVAATMNALWIGLERLQSGESWRP